MTSKCPFDICIVDGKTIRDLRRGRGFMMAEHQRRETRHNLETNRCSRYIQLRERSACFLLCSLLQFSYFSLTVPSINSCYGRKGNALQQHANKKVYPLLFSVPGHVAVVTSSETSRASMTKDKYLKSAIPRTSHITINVAVTLLVQQQLEKQRENRTAETLTPATCACMLYKQTSASFQVTAGCVVTVVQGTEMKIDSYL